MKINSFKLFLKCKENCYKCVKFCYYLPLELKISLQYVDHLTVNSLYWKSSQPENFVKICLEFYKKNIKIQLYPRLTATSVLVQKKFCCGQYGKVQEIESFKLSRKYALYTTSSLAIENMVV